MPSCAILACRKKSNKFNITHGNISYHRFPSESPRLLEWIEATGRTNWVPTKRSTICSTHFVENMFTIKTGKRYLKPEAVPTIKIVRLCSGISEMTQSNSSTSKVLNPPTAINQKVTEDIIARVYNYLQAEYEQLKSSMGASCDLSPLANVLRRTALATGVREQAVRVILEKRKRAADEELDAGAKRAKLSHDYGDGNVSPITDDESSYEAPDKEQDHVTEQDENNEQTQASQGQDEWEVEMLKVEIKEEEDDKPVDPQDPLLIQMNETDSAVQHLIFSSNSKRSNIRIATDTNSSQVRQRPAVVVYLQSRSGVQRVMSQEPLSSLAAVKIEPIDDSHYRSRSGVHRVMSQEPLSSLATVKIEPIDDSHYSSEVKIEPPPS